MEWSVSEVAESARFYVTAWCIFYGFEPPPAWRSEEHTSELQSLMRNSYAVFCLKKKKKTILKRININTIIMTHILINDSHFSFLCACRSCYLCFIFFF